jgi:hypothetical protein
MEPLMSAWILTLNDRYVAYEMKIRYHDPLIHHGKWPKKCSVPQLGTSWLLL